MIKHLSIKFFALSLWAASATPAWSDEGIDAALLNSSAIDREQFIQLCKPYIDKSIDPRPRENACILYFHGLRDGYLRAQYKVIDRAAIYYDLDGNIKPGGDYMVEYIAKAENAYDAPAYNALKEHETLCLRSIPTETLLQNFYHYVEQRRKAWDLSVFFDEFAQTTYAGKCKGSRLATEQKPPSEPQPAAVGDFVEDWHGRYQMEAPAIAGVSIDSAFVFGDKGFQILLQGNVVATGTYRKSADKLELDYTSGQADPAKKALILDANQGAVRFEGSDNPVFRKATE